MLVNTKFFGEIEIDEKSILNFEEGIPGLEDNHRFVMLDVDSKTSIKCLQSIDNSTLCLIITSPWDYFHDYEIELYDDDIEKLGIKSENDVVVYNVLTVHDEKMTVNLVAPIVINIDNNKAKQIVFSNLKYNIRQEIPCLYWQENLKNQL